MEAYTDRLDVATILGTLRVDTAAGQAIGEAELDALVESLQGEDLVWSLAELHAYRVAGRAQPR
jgi:hypothetical protein